MVTNIVEAIYSEAKRASARGDTEQYVLWCAPAESTSNDFTTSSTINMFMSAHLPDPPFLLPEQLYCSINTPTIQCSGIHVSILLLIWSAVGASIGGDLSVCSIFYQ